MSLEKSATGWLVDEQPGGRGGKRFRKTFKTKAEALAWQAWLKTQVNQNEKWQPDRRDTRKLSELIEVWFTHHGSGLRAGNNTKSRLLNLAKAIGNPVADRFSVEMFADYRTDRLKKGISQNNLNREHSYLRAVFNELKRLGQWKRENPLANLKAFKIQDREMNYLNDEQILCLLDALDESRNPHVKLVSKICLSTAARWSEAENLAINHVKPTMIEFADTKSGKTRNIPIDKNLHEEITAHIKKYDRTYRIFDSSEAAFRKAVERSGIVLPNGQSTHVLRHTYASHHMQANGNILTLQRILGHSDLKMTMKYAHMAPDHLQEVVKLNPISRLTLR